jgi:hypothetical protein
MSVKIMAQVWELDLPQNEKLVLLAFADHADDEGICFPSVARIARKTGYSERQVQTIGKQLRAKGLIAPLSRTGGGRTRGGSYLSVVYQISAEKGAKISPLKPKQGCSPAQLGVKPSAVRGEVATAPESSNNHQVEPSEKPSCAERSKTDRSTRQGSPPAPAPVIELPLNDGSEHAVLPEAVVEWKHLYPAVDVMQELRNMRGWLLANRQKRKTRRGIERFINSWLAKRQDKSGTEGVNGSRKGNHRKIGGAYHSGDPTRTYDREPDLIVNVP